MRTKCFWNHLFLLVIVFSVLFRFTASGYPFGIFKLFSSSHKIGKSNSLKALWARHPKGLNRIATICWSHPFLTRIATICWSHPFLNRIATICWSHPFLTRIATICWSHPEGGEQDSHNLLKSSWGRGTG